MTDYISDHLTAIVIALIGIFAGIAITVRYRRTSTKNSNNDNSANVVNQTNNKVKGDMAGRDINKR